MTEKFKQWSVNKKLSTVLLVALCSCSTANTQANLETGPKASPSPSPSPQPSPSSSPTESAAKTSGRYSLPDLTRPDSRKHESTESGIELEMTPREAPDGGMFFLKITTDPGRHESLKQEQVAVIFDQVKYPAFEIGPNVYGALVAIPFNSNPRKAKLVIELPGVPKAELDYEVVDGRYRSEILTVNPKYSSPPKKALKRIVREMKEIGAIYRKTTNERYWKGPFMMPIGSVMTSPFGNKRVFNGELKSFHQGLDLRAKVGTKIVAPEGGKVVLSKDLYFTGKAVILDHGHGLYTLYAHMSQLKVKKGQRVKKGDLLGLSGATGRISGPHLHWGAVLKGAKVNPLDLARVIPESFTP